MTDDRDWELVRRCLGGDTEAFEALVRPHEARLYNLCLRMSGSPTDSADLLQDVLLRAFVGLKGFRRDAQFGTWLYRIAANACLDWNRRRRGRVVSLDATERDLPLTEVLSDPTAGPEELALRRERAAQLSAALGQMSAEHRLVLLLRDVHGLSYEDIATAARVNLGTVKSRLARARQELRRRLSSSELFAALNVKLEQKEERRGLQQGRR